MKVLLTGFEPYGPERESRSWAWISGLEALERKEHQVETLQLPSTWDDCFVPLLNRLRERWDAVICIGERDGESMTIERLALNETDVTLADRAGRRPPEKVIDPAGEPDYWSGLPHRELRLRLSAAGIPASPSHSSGDGLGNMVFYKLMRWIAASGNKMTAGLIQVPKASRSIEINDRMKETFLSCILDTLQNSEKRGAGLAVDANRIKSLRSSPSDR